MRREFPKFQLKKAFVSFFFFCGVGQSLKRVEKACVLVLGFPKIHSLFLLFFLTVYFVFQSRLVTNYASLEEEWLARNLKGEIALNFLEFNLCLEMVFDRLGLRGFAVHKNDCFHVVSQDSKKASMSVNS